MERYFGTYQTFRTVSKKDAALLMGSNTLVGDRYRINLTMSVARGLSTSSTKLSVTSTTASRAN